MAGNTIDLSKAHIVADDASLAPWGNSRGVRIPKQALKDAGVQSDQHFTIGAAQGCIILMFKPQAPARRKRRRIMLSEVLATCGSLGDRELGPTGRMGDEAI